ncbi:MAG: alpha/beta hydrolase [Janthinobacterium lividum]
MHVPDQSASRSPLRTTQANVLPFDGPQPEPDGAGLWRADDVNILDANPRLRHLRQFHSAYLPDDRDLFVWLPPVYGTEPERRFPVLYLHDGQNLIDGRTSYVPGRIWNVHTTADRLAEEALMEPVILVGINNTGLRRMAEYTPSRDLQFGGGEGFLYGRLLVDEIKPLIDESFRTKPEFDHTGLAGSSLGGLISLALGLSYPRIFGKLGVLSPSVWWDHREILTRVGRVAPNPRPRVWLDMGMSEGLRHLRDCDLLHHRLLTRGWRDEHDICYLRVPDGVHDEEAWSRRFDRVLQWLFPPAPIA